MKKSLPYVALAIAIICLFTSCLGPKEKKMHSSDEYLSGHVVTFPDGSAKYGIMSLEIDEEVRLIVFENSSLKESIKNQKVKFQLSIKGDLAYAKNITVLKDSDNVLNDGNHVGRTMGTDVIKILDNLSVNAHNHLYDENPQEGRHRIWHPQKGNPSRIKTIAGVTYENVLLTLESEPNIMQEVYVQQSQQYIIFDPSGNPSKYYIHKKIEIPGLDTMIVEISTEHPPHILILDQSSSGQNF